MSMDRIHWEALPAAARAAVTDHTGIVIKAETAAGGVNSGIAARLHTLDTTVFVKGVPTDHPQIATQQREADVNPYLPAASPRLLWHVTEAGWDLLGYQHLDARHAAYEPGSPDLPLVADAVAELQDVELPDEVKAKEAPQRWAAYAGDEDTAPLAGRTLLHTDLAPHNVLITNRAHLIDWAWPTRGAAWIDPAVLILRLMEAGHSAVEADAWAAGRFPSWANAPADAVQVFNDANARLWAEVAGADPRAWKRRMSDLACEWASYWRKH